MIFYYLCYNCYQDYHNHMQFQRIDLWTFTPIVKQDSIKEVFSINKFSYRATAFNSIKIFNLSIFRLQPIRFKGKNSEIY